MYLTVQVSEQQLRMEVISRHHLVATLGFPQVRVDDGEWHHLLVELRSIKEGKDIKYVASVSLDYGMYQVSFIALRGQYTSCHVLIKNCFTWFC